MDATVSPTEFMINSDARSLLDSLEEEGNRIDLNKVNAVCRVSIASPDLILQWSRRHCRQTDRTGICKCGKTPLEQAKCSFGEVTKPETINYRTFKPEKDGLFCERIFGPVKDWECSCGKYKRIKYKGIVCDRCGVEVIESRVRRQRLGHIKLAAPVCHIWFYKGTTSRISHLLDISPRDLGKVIYFQDYIVVDPEDTPLKAKQILSDDEVRKHREAHGDKGKIMIGAEAVKELLRQLDVVSLAESLGVEMRNASSAQKRNKVIKRLKVVEAFRTSGNKPEWMILDVLPVIPPDLRPLVHLDGGRFATSDLNDLYRRVINRNNRLRRLIDLRAPDVILRNEKRMLQEAVDALFDNSRRGRPTKGHNNRPLKSLSDMLKGKQGRFRQNLLGKRVDYSGRSVIVVGPELRFNECGLPKKMALELFDPFIVRELQRRGYCNTIKAAKKMIEREESVVYDILDDITKDHPVLLNRAPTLHRLGVQAFLPKLVEGKAIRLHPMACMAFNADFDGDQMAVHVPLSNEAVLEAKQIMLAENNILRPSNGTPVATPDQDVVLGCYYLTRLVPNRKGSGMRFSSPAEAIQAMNYGQVDLQAPVFVRVPEFIAGEGPKVVECSVGRLLFDGALPNEVSYFDKKYPFANETMEKSSLMRIVQMIHKTLGYRRAAETLDNMKKLGFSYARNAGISICIDDMRIPPSKVKIISEAHKEVAKVQDQYGRGHLTDEERYHKVIDIWTHASDRVAQEMMALLKKDQEGLNPVHIMSTSGARGNASQIRQLGGMRGLMQKPTKKITGSIGEIIEQPIISNFREGLTVLEYFISTHGARKGLADTALKTSDAGYLTRRLVDVAQDVIITEKDCGTVNGIMASAIKEITTQGERVMEPLRERIVGRVPVDNVIHPNTGKIIATRTEIITDEIAREIEEAGFEELLIRSVLTCETRGGVCAQCYGRDMAGWRMVELGEAVGVIAAQSIGEPGTQLTLRTFHIGGAVSRSLEGWYEASNPGIVRYRDELKASETADGLLVVLNRTGSIRVEDDNGNTIQVLPNIRYGATLMKRDGDRVEKGEQFVKWDPHHTPILTEESGYVRMVDIIPGITLREDFDPKTNVTHRVITEHKEERHPSVQIVDEEGNLKANYAMTAGAIMAGRVKDGDYVDVGRVLARLPRIQVRSKDITGGLPRIDELFEARKPKDSSFIAEIDGAIQFRGIIKGVRKVAIVADNGDEVLYNIPLVRHMTVHDNQRVVSGESITDGSLNPHDILRVSGEKAVQEFLVAEVQEVYRLQGVNINDKHIECIIRQMLKKVIVEEVGDTHFLYGQQVDKFEFQTENDRTVKKGGKPAVARPKLLGLTKASLETDSFISAASFQETTRVLTDASVRGRFDTLSGLKENVIMGLLIPAGTGLPYYRNIKVEPDIPQSEWVQQPAPQAAAEKKAAPKDKIFDEIADLDTSDSWDGSADTDDDDGDDE
ncbi:MAG TPA: DNA-directed RNA polymerase subunit beta' [Candidatus Sumerlaeota bacterium]|nr:DNA-directed RNA polymerase subunit beta' [Candidatus Sumerlaeota bacterium]